MEVLPEDHTWQSTSIDVESNEVKWLKNF
jgi:hypothetical protein